MLYRACCLYVDTCEDAPTWVHAVAGANTDLLEEAIEVAWEFAQVDNEFNDQDLE
jgi:hypothetical protein